MLDTSKIYSSNNYGDFKIVNYINANHVEIDFIATGFKAITEAGNIRRGEVKDRLHPNVCGVGFIGEGEYGRNSKPYKTWRGVLERCYCPKYQKKRPTYIGVTVCNDWHNFQNFAKWFEDNYIEGFHIDKDIKQRGVKNKVYGPNTCKFVSQKDNNIEASAKNYRMRDPSGVVHVIYNLSEFARKNGLSKECLYAVNSRKSKHHKGWTKDYQECRATN